MAFNYETRQAPEIQTNHDGLLLFFIHTRQALGINFITNRAEIVLFPESVTSALESYSRRHIRSAEPWRRHYSNLMSKAISGEIRQQWPYNNSVGVITLSDPPDEQLLSVDSPFWMAFARYHPNASLAQEVTNIIGRVVLKAKEDRNRAKEARDHRLLTGKDYFIVGWKDKNL